MSAGDNLMCHKLFRHVNSKPAFRVAHLTIIERIADRGGAAVDDEDEICRNMMQPSRLRIQFLHRQTPHLHDGPMTSVMALQ